MSRLRTPASCSKPQSRCKLSCAWSCDVLAFLRPELIVLPAPVCRLGEKQFALNFIEENAEEVVKSAGTSHPFSFGETSNRTHVDCCRFRVGHSAAQPAAGAAGVEQAVHRRNRPVQGRAALGTLVSCCSCFSCCLCFVVELAGRLLLACQAWRACGPAAGSLASTLLTCCLSSRSECKRQTLTDTLENKKKVLADVLPLIRFPVMSMEGAVTTLQLRKLFGWTLRCHALLGLLVAANSPRVCVPPRLLAKRGSSVRLCLICCLLFCCTMCRDRHVREPEPAAHQRPAAGNFHVSSCRLRASTAACACATLQRPFVCVWPGSPRFLLPGPRSL